MKILYPPHRVYNGESALEIMLMGGAGCNGSSDDVAFSSIDSIRADIASSGSGAATGSCNCQVICQGFFVRTLYFGLMHWDFPSHAFIALPLPV